MLLWRIPGSPSPCDALPSAPYYEESPGLPHQRRSLAGLSCWYEGQTSVLNDVNERTPSSGFPRRYQASSSSGLPRPSSYAAGVASQGSLSKRYQQALSSSWPTPSQQASSSSIPVWRHTRPRGHRANSYSNAQHIVPNVPSCTPTAVERDLSVPAFYPDQVPGSLDDRHSHRLSVNGRRRASSDAGCQAHHPFPQGDSSFEEHTLPYRAQDLPKESPTPPSHDQRVRSHSRSTDQLDVTVLNQHELPRPRTSLSDTRPIPRDQIFGGTHDKPPNFSDEVVDRGQPISAIPRHIEPDVYRHLHSHTNGARGSGTPRQGFGAPNAHESRYPHFEYISRTGGTNIGLRD